MNRVRSAKTMVGRVSPVLAPGWDDEVSPALALVTHGHSAFFGLGLYGAAAALLVMLE